MFEVQDDIEGRISTIGRKKDFDNMLLTQQVKEMDAKIKLLEEKDTDDLKKQTYDR